MCTRRNLLTSLCPVAAIRRTLSLYFSLFLFFLRSLAIFLILSRMSQHTTGRDRRLTGAGVGESPDI